MDTNLQAVLEACPMVEEPAAKYVVIANKPFVEEPVAIGKRYGMDDFKSRFPYLGETA